MPLDSIFVSLIVGVAAGLIANAIYDHYRRR